MVGRSAAIEQEIRFCTSADGVRLAYATAGQGPPLVKAANWLSHLEFDWRSPVWRHWLEELSRDHMLIRYDERGCGLSDWDVEDFSLEAWVRDLESVVDALELERFPLLALSQGGPVAITYAVRHPERVSHLILYGTYSQGWAKRRLSSGQMEEYQALLTLTRRGWGRDNPAYRQIFTTSFIPDASPDQARWFNDLMRVSASPENAFKFFEAFGNLDVDDMLPQVTAPTLVLHARNDFRCPFEAGRRVAAEIPGARFVPLDSANHILLETEPAWPIFLSEVRRFLEVAEEQAAPAPVVSEPSLVTVLFTDVEGSTALTQRLGDSRARELLREHERIMRECLKSHGGSELKTMGDGFMASFPSATRALECAIAMQHAFAQRNESSPEQVLVRVGVNAGEPIAEERDLFGTAVIAAARIAAQAKGGEILASDTVRGLVAGKGFSFADRGEAALKGFEEPVRLNEVRWREDG